MIRVGLVGFGMAGRVFHGPLLASVEGLELVSVVERASSEAAARYPGVRTCRSLDEMLADESLDLLVVATPSGTHYELAREILRSGRNVVVDKPLAVRADEIAELMALAEGKNLLLAPFQNRRFDGDFLTVARLLREEAVGGLVFFESRFDRWRPNAPTSRLWKESLESGGGVLLDLGTHLADQALALFGKPEAIAASVLRERAWARVDDGFEMRLRYPGFTAALGSNSLSLPAGARFHLRGSRGNYWKHGLDPQEAALNAIARIADADWGREPQSAWGTLYREGDTGVPVETLAGDYRRFYEGIRDALMDGAAPPATAVEAWRTARLLEWARESSHRRAEIACDWSEEPATNFTTAGARA